jgi:DNA-binding transcriptional regulator YiaG
MEAKEIKQMRLKLKLSQQVFATKLGVGITTVSRWENGISIPSHLAMAKLEEMNKEVGN